MSIMSRGKKKKDKPISKEKVKDCISILEVAQVYSPKINERAKKPLIICPFHEDRNLGSCRIYPDTNTFKCEACGAHGDTLKLASGYLGIKLSEMNALLEKLVSEFGIIRDTVVVEYNGNSKTSPPERLSPEEYKELLMSDHYSIPSRFEQIEYEENEWDYVPCEYSNIYYRTLAVKDPEFHDWVICTVSRKYWQRFTDMLFYCQSINFTLMEEVLAKKIENSKRLLKKGLVNKQLYRQELRLRNQILNESLIERSISA